ncbi:imidazoleglycerol-phosphate dehydratase HisB [Tepidiforma sp.]|uniref:imidazoleglycerol-phosphate dehydratase HisB n=1 Tax=Tepidiforma sp. TaxID=2682230 RepID=UPI002ADD5F14|nr:imidazoleglycerol-phosphate dehydratase HisB [Tepidiforma sp.]
MSDTVAPSTSPRIAVVSRRTAETAIDITLCLDGSGKFSGQTGVGFLDHMLAHIAKHGVFDLDVRCEGDLWIDQHHSVEDVGICLGEALGKAIGDKAGLVRAGSAFMPLDEALAHAVVDLSGRPYAVLDLKLLGRELGGLPPDLFDHFLESFAFAAKINLHVRVLYGTNDHHKCEAAFKAMARALDAATRIDPRRGGDIPSTKGTL